MEALNRRLVPGRAKMRKSIGFTTTAVVTLAMAIAANAVVFSVMNGFILRPVNVPEPHIRHTIERASDNSANQSYPE